MGAPKKTPTTTTTTPPPSNEEPVEKQIVSEEEQDQGVDREPDGDKSIESGDSDSVPETQTCRLCKKEVPV